MSQNEVERLSQEEALLIEQLNAIRLKKQEAEKQTRLEEIQKETLNISNIEIVQDKVYFKSNYREDFILFLRAWPGRGWNGESNYIPAESWMEFEAKVREIPNVVFTLTEDEQKTISEWKPSPKFKIQRDDRTIVVWIGPKARGSILHRIPGCEVHHVAKGTYYRIPFSEGANLFSKLQEEDGVEWENETLEFVEEQIKNRKRLDEIAKLDDAEINVDLGDHQLKPFQKVGVKFVETAGWKVIIADEMGLGKTPQSIAAMKLLDDIHGAQSKHLIVCPAALKANWDRQIRKFTGSVPYTLYGSEPQNIDIVQILKGDYKYYIINYDIISTKFEEKEKWQDENGFWHNKVHVIRPWVTVLNLAGFKSVTLDEAHKIKNLDAARTQAVRELQADAKFLLTGTPMLNRPGELWPLISYIDPQLVGSYDSFVMRYTYDKKTARNVDELREILKPIMIRRTKKDVMKDLPPIDRIDQTIELSDKARAMYNKALDGFWLEFDNWDGSPAQATAITSLLAQIMKLKQICAFDKVEYISDLAFDISESLNGGEHNKVIIFSQFVNHPECVKEIARRLGHEALTITGDIPVIDRQPIVERFQNDPTVKFLVCSTAAASEGLDMTKAGAVVFNDLMWTPAAHQQAEGRAYGRINDPHPISSYYVTFKNTIEEDIAELLLAKLNMFNEIVEGAEASRDTSIAMELLQRIRAKR